VTLRIGGARAIAGMSGIDTPQGISSLIDHGSGHLCICALGSMSSGAMAGAWGAPRAAAVVGVMGISLVLILAAVAPKLRRF